AIARAPEPPEPHPLSLHDALPILGHAERSYVSELNEHRNAWAHQKPISNEDAYRCADTATRLLEAVGAPTQAQVTRDIAQELLRDRKSTRLNSSHVKISYAVFCLT